MPVILSVPRNPTDIVVQGEQLHGFEDYPEALGSALPLMADPYPWPYADPIGTIVAGEQVFDPLIGGHPVSKVEVQRSMEAGSMAANNAMIATPTGALYPVQPGRHIMEDFQGSTKTWVIAGVTRDSAEAALGNCNMVVLEVGRLGFDSAPVAAVSASDGSGNFSIPVPLNVAYQVIANKPGSPDVAGVSVITRTPT